MWPGASQWGERVSVLFSPSNINISIFFLVLSLCFFSLLGEGRNGNEVSAFSQYSGLFPWFSARFHGFAKRSHQRFWKASIINGRHHWSLVEDVWTRWKRNVNLDIPVGVSYPLNVLSALILAMIVSDCHREPSACGVNVQLCDATLRLLSLRLCYDI